MPSGGAWPAPPPQTDYVYSIDKEESEFPAFGRRIVRMTVDAVLAENGFGAALHRAAPNNE